MKILEPFPYRDNFTGKTVTGKRVVTEWEEGKKIYCLLLINFSVNIWIKFLKANGDVFTVA